ncbi:hypothetical protein DSL72_000090 [Monilinia vaccinii-corymbosi]|uniref:Uncharacterized protein n=1 Tax=Monilinia vaccinii-corymbosi TaxID=61207 RepID=A0A8A3P570_9HELO|nr:hypothetical protein DSL72_000090 [Monilinia vaccinii-corymbosi]
MSYYPWRPTAARNIYADSAASTSSLPGDYPSNNLPIAVGTVASRVLFLQKLAGNQKNKSAPKTPLRFPPTRPTRREKSDKSPQRSRSPPQVQPPSNRRRENSRSSFGRRPANIFGTPASRNSQPNEQLQTGTRHSFLGLQTPRSNHDEGHARAVYNGTPRTDGYIEAQLGGLPGMVRADAHASSWAPVTETLKTSSRNLDRKIASHRLHVGRGVQRVEDRLFSTQSPSNPQISKQRTRIPSPHRQKRKARQDERSNSKTSTATTSTLRRQSVRDLFDTHGIEIPPGLASSEMVRAAVNSSQRHRICHLCMWIHDKNENICWKCGHRLCEACDRLSPSFKGGEASFGYEEGLSGHQPKPSKSGPYTTTPRPAKRQIIKQSMMKPMKITLQTNKKDDTRKETLDPKDPKDPFPPFYSKESPPQHSNERGLNLASQGPLSLCPGIYVPSNPQEAKFKPEDASKAHLLHLVTESFRQHISKDHRSSTRSPPSDDPRSDSCQPIDYRSFVCRHPTSPSLAQSDDFLAMDGGYTGENGNNENIYHSRSHPESSQTSQPPTRLYGLLNGFRHRTQPSHDPDRRHIPRTSTRSYKFATGLTHQKTYPSYKIDQADCTKTQQLSENPHHLLSKPTYQPVQPNYGSDHTENPQPLDNFNPFTKKTTTEEVQSRYGSDYVACHGYPRTGHWDCNRSPVSSGILGDCQHCLDDCECSACRSTVHSVRCCTNEVHKPMMHHHHSPTKISLHASYGSSTGKLSSERKPYVLSHSQTYDRSTLHKYDCISEWLGSPDEAPPQRADTPKMTPTKAVHTSKNSSPEAATNFTDLSAIPQAPPPCVQSLKPTTPKGVAPLMKKALDKASQDGGKVRASLNGASSSDGVKGQSLVPARSSSRISTPASPGYLASNPWREKEMINFPQRHDDWKTITKSPLTQQVSRRSTDCRTSDICGQSDWAEQRHENKNSTSDSRNGLTKPTELEQVRKMIDRWEDGRAESGRGRGRGRGQNTITSTASEMATPVSGGYFDAKMRWCSSGSMRGIGGSGGVVGMGSIEEEEGEGEGEVESTVDDDGGERHDCIWRKRATDLGEREKDDGSRDERERGVEGIGGVQGVTIVLHMDRGEDIVLRMNSGGKLSWEGLERLLRGV